MTKKRTFRSFSSSHHHKADPIGFLQAFSQYVPALLYSRRHPQSTDYPYPRHLTSACNRHISSYNPHNHLTFPPHHQNFHTSTVSSASSGHYNIDIDDGIPVKQKGISQSIFEASV